MLIIAVSAAVIILDQTAKLIAGRLIPLHDSIALIPGILHLTMVHNRGAAFGIFKGGVYFFITAAVAAAGTIIFYLSTGREKIPRVTRVGLSLILGGAVGNLIDRIIHGYVIDFIDFRIWPVFNFADTAISCGTALMLFYLIRNR